MAHTSYGELRQLFETFTRVLGASYPPPPHPGQQEQGNSDIPQVDGEKDKDTEESLDDFDLEDTSEQEIIFNCEDCE